MGFAVRAADVFDHSDVRVATVARVWQGFSRTVYLAKGSASELPFTVRRSELVEVGLEDVAAYVEGETVILPYLDTLEPVIAIRFTPPETVHVAWVYVPGEWRDRRPPERKVEERKPSDENLMRWAEMEGVELPGDDIGVAGAVAARVAAFLLAGFVKLSRRVPPSEALNRATAMTLSRWALERLLLCELAGLNTAG